MLVMRPRQSGFGPAGNTYASRAFARGTHPVAALVGAAAAFLRGWNNHAPDQRPACLSPQRIDQVARVEAGGTGTYWAAIETSFCCVCYPRSWDALTGAFV